MATIKRDEFGKTEAGIPVDIYTLSTQTMSVKVLTRGCAFYEVNVPDRKGTLANVCSNMKSLADYERRRTFFGAFIGRFGNRIANATFEIEGQTYTLAKNPFGHAIHGGPGGFDTVIWKVERATANGDEAVLEFSRRSPDGEEGYPGNLDVHVIYTLSEGNRLQMEYTAATDRQTFVNLTNHTFWNLAGSGSSSILGHKLTLAADRYLPTREGLIPTGEIASVEGTALDFRAERRVGEKIGEITEPWFSGGYDHCLILGNKPKGEMTLAAKLADPESGRTMMVETTEPALQFYSGNFLDGTIVSAEGLPYPKQSLLCLEAQHYPDSPHQPAFPSTLLEPGNTYRQTTIHTFGTEDASRRP